MPNLVATIQIPPYNVLKVYYVRSNPSIRMIRTFFTLVVASLFIAQSSGQSRQATLPADLQKELLSQGWHPGDLVDMIEADRYTSAHNGVEHLFLRQRWQGIEVWNADIVIHRGSDGRMLRVNNGSFKALERHVNATTPSITAAQALQQVLSRTAPGMPLPPFVGVEDGGRLHRFDGTLLGNEIVLVKLVFQPVGDSLRLAWNVNHYLPDGSHWWNIRLDALTGVELDRNDWVVNCGLDHDHTSHGIHEAPEEDAPPAPAAPNDYRVYAWPTESPTHGGRTIQNAPWLGGGIASPFGWHDTNGATGPEYTDTRGNNCRAQEDADANNTGGARPSGGPTLDFDFPIDLTQAPATYLDAATTNLFYWNNIIHDVWYQYGFNEVAGNFQENNYGRGGLGNDWVNADSQDGSGTNNANFGTPPDGSNPRMQMFRWTQTTPNRDSDLDNVVIAHEYGHGISNRLVAGPSNVNCLSNAEQMGEGWSDYIGLVMTMKPGDTRTQGRGVGTYLLGQPITGVGIRNARYSTSFGVNGFTYANTNNTSQISVPHGIGFVWCTMLWEMTWDLIDQYGFDPDIYSGTGGNNLAMQLVIDGLKLTPCSPGFVDGRDAILLADQINNGGANQDLIWAAFARRGLGASASQGSTNSRIDQVAAFDMPVANNVGITSVLSPQGQLLECGGAGTPVTVLVRNNGLEPQGNFSVAYQMDNGPLVQENFAATLQPGTAVPFTFSTLVDLGGVGLRTITATTQLPGDQFAGDDTQEATVEVLPATLFPATFTEGLSAASPTPEGWRLENPDASGTWTTSQLNIGPSCAAERSWAIDNYSYNASGQEDRLITPLVDLGGSAGSRLKFHHAYRGYSAAYVDGLRVDISSDCGATWNTVFFQQSGDLATGTNTTSAFVPSNCDQWRLNDIDISAYDGQNVLVRFVAINGYGNWLYLDNVVIERNGISVALQLMLNGPYDPVEDRMRDDLRVAGLIPVNEPYTALSFTQIGGGGENVDNAVLDAGGENAVVDWVFIELREASAPYALLATRSALLQRDGDVVDKDGISPVAFGLLPGSYHIAVRHRNHIGCMTAAPVTIGTTAFPLNFSDPAVATFGTNARRILPGRATLWTGEVYRDGSVKYTGLGNDRDLILQAVGGVVLTNTVTGYLSEDLNLDGVVRYTGGDNDRDLILQTIGGVVPTNTRDQQTP